jgi:small redox-active disulfide protein 2
VRVYGPGCANCERLAANAISALADLGLDADFEHVKDIDEIVAMGPVGLPALAINGNVVAAGRVPSRENIIELLKEAAE